MNVRTRLGGPLLFLTLAYVAGDLRDARATPLPYVQFLTCAATDIVVGTVPAQSIVSVDHDTIITRTVTVDIDESLKGPSSAGSQVSVQLLGGTVGTKTVTMTPFCPGPIDCHAPDLAPGDRVLLFLEGQGIVHAVLGKGAIDSSDFLNVEPDSFVDQTLALSDVRQQILDSLPGC